jgi:hypothetical protein
MELIQNKMIYRNRIWVYALCYNEAPFVKHFLTAYKEAERIVIYDNQSTDGCRELLCKDSRVEIRENDSGNQIRDDLYVKIKDNCWKEARGQADWVIVIDFDEIFTRARMINGIAVFDLDLTDVYMNGWNVIYPYGYNMSSLEAPLYADGHPFEYSQKGAVHNPERKMCCFRPDQVGEMRYQAGAHVSNPLDINGSKDGIRILNNIEYKLLHYKFWNLDYYMKRMEEYQTRMSDINKERGWGGHYLMSMQAHHDIFVFGCNLAKPLFDIVWEE